jgi:two-component system KDP operon response regulator KdpE
VLIDSSAVECPLSKEKPVGKVTNRILIVANEANSRRNLRAMLVAFGYRISEAAGEEAAFLLIQTSEFGVILIDLPTLSVGGLGICQRVRRVSRSTAILMAIERNSPDDAVLALEVGADDCITRPVDHRELRARVRAAIRRSRVHEAMPERIIIGDITLDSNRRALLKKGRRVHLTPTEFELLRLLMSHSGRALSHQRLLRVVWGVEFQGELEYLRTFMHQIRKKLEEDPARPQYVLTSPHYGYRFASESDTEIGDRHSI